MQTHILNPLQERWLIFTVGLVQFINILDFMMVMPMGPDFARALGIPTHHIGYIGGSYTFAAAISGLIGAFFLDRFSRLKVLLVSLFGLIIATACGALAWNMESLIAARVLAGLFGGPLTSASISMIADYIPPERRGAAMGKVMGSFAAASVLGVPFGLEISALFGWKYPFMILAGVGCVVLLIAYRKLPRRNDVMPPSNASMQAMRVLVLLKNPLALMAFLLMGLSMMAGFMVIPNIAGHLQQNWHVPRDHLAFLYFCGGLVSFFGMRLSGAWVDKASATIVSVVFTTTLIIAIAAGFVFYPNPIPVVVIFIVFMASMTGRTVAAQTLVSKVPLPEVRAAFMSINSAVTHIASSMGAFYSSLILVDDSSGHLLHIDIVGITAIGISLLVPPLFYLTERRLKRVHMDHHSA